MKTMRSLGLLTLIIAVPTAFAIPQEATVKRHTSAWNTFAKVGAGFVVATPAIAARTAMTSAAYALCNRYVNHERARYMPVTKIGKAKLALAVIVSAAGLITGNKFVDEARNDFAKLVATNLDADATAPDLTSPVARDVDYVGSAAASAGFLYQFSDKIQEFARNVCQGEPEPVQGNSLEQNVE